MDSLFKDRESINGVLKIVTCKIANRNIYLIGESHSYNGDNTSPDYLPHIILNEKSNDKLDILIESSVYDAVNITHNITSPLTYILNLYKNKPNIFSETHDIKFIDIRRDIPYALLLILYNVEYYIVAHTIKDYKYKAKYIEFRRKCKLFERDVILHLSSRIKTEKFILSMIHPDKQMPKWYKKWLLSFGHDDKEHEIKEKLSNLKITNNNVYKKIIKFIANEISLRIMDVNEYSDRMISLENSRNTESNTFVLNKPSKKNTETYIVFMFAILMDFWTLTDILCSDNDCVLIAGLLHTHSVAKYLIDSNTCTESESVEIDQTKLLNKKNINKPAQISNLNYNAVIKKR